MKRLEGKSRTVAQTLGLVVTMGALAWDSVPFYDWFCRVTGYGGTTNVAEADSDVVLDREINLLLCVRGSHAHPHGRLRFRS